MDPANEAILELGKACSTVMIEASGLITPGPSYIFSIDLSPEDATLVWQLDVYDGENAAGKHTFCLEGQFVPRHLCYGTPLFFRRGIYLAFTTNIGCVTIQFLPRKD
jgi:hypothetical protein